MSDLLHSFNQPRRDLRILILGDLMLDLYTWGDAERVSPEAPVIVLRADDEEVRPGGAASVAYLLKHLDVQVCLAGLIGDDTDGHTLRALIRDEGIDDQFVLTDPNRPTTAKHRFVGRASDRHPHQILRVDRESRKPIATEQEYQLWTAIKEQLHQFDALLIADYMKGVCTESLLQNVITTARSNNQKILIDPGRNADYRRYRGTTLLKPNRAEAEAATITPVSWTSSPSECDKAKAPTSPVIWTSSPSEFDVVAATTSTTQAQAQIDPKPEATTRPAAFIIEDEFTSEGKSPAEPQATKGRQPPEARKPASQNKENSHLIQSQCKSVPIQPVIDTPPRINQADRNKLSRTNPLSGSSVNPTHEKENSQTPPEHHATRHSITTPEDALQVANQLRETYDIETVIITLDRDGLVVASAQTCEAIPTTPRTVYDITGAGDMVLATLGLCLAGNISVMEAAKIANIAAGLEVERFGIAPVSRDEIASKCSRIAPRNGTRGGQGKRGIIRRKNPGDPLSKTRNRHSKSRDNNSQNKIVALDQLMVMVRQYRSQGKRIVFTNGCFDLLHVGHVNYLQEAAALGDILIVAVNSDASVKQLKGHNRPVVNERDRALLIAVIEYVDLVVIFEDDTPMPLLTAVRPDILIKGGTTNDIVGTEFVQSYGGTVCRSGEVIGVSTTALIKAATQALTLQEHK